MPNTQFDRSVFAPYFEPSDAQAVAWAENVLSKLPDEIIPKYIVREDGNGETDLEDYLRPICIFFSYLVRFAREFRDFENSTFLVNEYLLNKGHYTAGVETLEQLTWSLENLLRRGSHRGSIKSIEKVDNLNQSPNRPNGEILELFGWHYFLFFKLGVPRPQYNSWNVNNCSPCFRGTTGRYDLNIGYENSEDVYDISKYPILNSNYVSVDVYRGKNCLHIEQVPFGQFAGIGLHDQNFEIVVDPRQNFEITFYIAQDITLENITFGCYAFDVNGSVVNLKNVVNDSDSNMFFETRRLNKAGRFYMVRGIIFNKDHELIPANDAKLNIGFGHNLKFQENVVSIIPYIVMDNDFSFESDSEFDQFESDSLDDDSGATGSDESGYWSDDAYDNEPSIYIWNFKVTPSSTNYGRSYLNNKNFIDIFGVNNSGKYNDEEIKVILRKYFIPYNTAFDIALGSGVDVPDPEDIEPSLLLLEEQDEEGGDDLILQDQEDGGEEEDGFLIE